MGAGPLTPLQNMGIVDEHHVAGRAADHFQAVPAGGGKRQALAEHTAGAQLLQHSGDSLLVDADQGCLPPLHHAYGVASRAGEVVDHLVHPIAPLHRLKAVQHLLVILVPDVLKQGALFQFLWGQHRGRSLLLHISHFIIAASVEKVKTVLRQIS